MEDFIVGDDEDEAQLTQMILDSLKDFPISNDTAQNLLKSQQPQLPLTNNNELDEEEEEEESDEKIHSILKYDNDDDYYYDDEDEEDDDGTEEDNNIDDDDEIDDVVKINLSNSQDFITPKISNLTLNANNTNLNSYNNNNNNNNNNSIPPPPPPLQSLSKINNNIKPVNNNSTVTNNKNNNQKKDNDDPLTFDSSIFGLFSDSYDLFTFLAQQGIDKCGQLATLEISEGVLEDHQCAVFTNHQTLIRSILKSNYDANPDNKEIISQLIKQDHLLDNLNSLSSLYVLVGFSDDDEVLFKSRNILTLEHLVKDSKTNFVRDNPKNEFFCFMATKVVNYLARQQVLAEAVSVKPRTSIYVYHYTNMQSITDIAYTRGIKTPKALFEDFIQTETHSRFNHPWRKIYFSYFSEAAKHCNVSNPTDLDVYSYLIWRSSSSTGLSAHNCLGGVQSIFFFWQKTPPTKNLGFYDKELENCITIDLTSVLEEGYQVFNCSKDKSGKMSKDVWYQIDTVSAQSLSKVDNWCTYVEGSDPKLNIPQGCIILNDGILQDRFYSLFQKPGSTNPTSNTNNNTNYPLTLPSTLPKKQN